MEESKCHYFQEGEEGGSRELQDGQSNLEEVMKKTIWKQFSNIWRARR